MGYDVIDAGNGKIIKAWRQGVPFEEKAIAQLKNTAQLPFIFKWLAAMPDCHWGMGSTVGTVLPTINAIVPAAVGVDIGCGMMALKLKSTRIELSTSSVLRSSIEAAVPHGRTNNGGLGDKGVWETSPEYIQKIWDSEFAEQYGQLIKKHPGAKARNTVVHIGTLGTGNHFIELAEDENEGVWLVLHSGSRGMGNKIGDYFTRLAKSLCEKWFISLPDSDLAYLPRGTEEFDDYCRAVSLAQKFAWRNREVMADNILQAIGQENNYTEKIQCHHNYISWENHFGQNVMITRKGAVRAAADDVGIIPGSMGARTYIVKGLGNPDSFHTCSHGAGRAMGRREATRRFTLEDHLKATEGVECLKDATVLDETPGAYKDIEAVMAAQADLVEPVYRLKQFVCVKGGDDKVRSI